MEYFTHQIIGSNKPHLAIIACTHGDEIIGKKIFDQLVNIKIAKGSLHLVVANTLAVNKKKRFIKKDLNRSFPGKKNGVLEEKIAYQLTPILKKMDYVIDVHATNSDFKKLIITVHKNKKINEILKVLATKKIAHMQSPALGKKSLISVCKNSFCLEYGPNKTGKNYKVALKDIKLILKKLDIIKKTKPLRKYNKKELFIVQDSYSVTKNFIQNPKLKDFHLIKKYELIGKVKNKKIYSTKKFYPIFLGKGRYLKTLALVAQKKLIKL
jgi:succinylglutamate desuccinylase